MGGSEFLALFDFISRATVVSQVSVVRPWSVNSGFSETTAWIQVKFYGQLPVLPISIRFLNVFFSEFQIFNFYDFFYSFSLKWDPMGEKVINVLAIYQKICGTLKFLLTQNHMGLEISKRYSSYNFDPI